MRVNCSKCGKEMVIDEPNGEAYITEGIKISYDAQGNVEAIDTSGATVHHVVCPPDNTSGG